MVLPRFEKLMFDRIHLIEGTTGALYHEEEKQFDIDNNDVTHHGTAELLLEEQEKKIRWSKQLKFNKAFDVAKVLAEVMSLQSSLKMFLSSIYRLQNRTWQSMLQTGLPEDLLKSLEFQISFKLLKQVIVSKILLSR